MIKRQWSERKKKFIHLLDVRLESGERIRRSFDTKSEADAVESLYKRNKVIERYALPVAQERPTLAQLIEKVEKEIKNEKARVQRVFADLVKLLPKRILVHQIKSDMIELYVKKRFADKVSPQTINRELTMIAAMLNGAGRYFAALESWRPPKMPRPRIYGGRRERVWRETEIDRVLAQLTSPRRPGERAQTVRARQRVGDVLRFCFLTGLRPGEIAKIRFCDVDWENGKIRVEQGKLSGRVKHVGPLFEAVEILKSFAAGKHGADFVFFRGPRITGMFRRILRKACASAGVPYGKNTPGGVVLYDARHTVTTHLLESGVSPAAVKEWMGWSDAQFVLYYSHSTDKSREKAGRALERLAGRKLRAVA